ncbi:hypothetical protein SAMN05444411_101196 [Lutibacter oricola]|uniref:Uncharacterized protein n=1 Tax=Lutibacter oricola TaxID=762486 RepID=A0A1H2RBB2_9FLAO|nr:hypothetical protein [Lutibacter oricola]SDW16776.1 hypothetical protein SAMN05444411_101196 [Lutibacter oricola]
MKLFHNIILIITIPLLFSNCSTSQSTFVKKAPFTIKNASYSYWTGGRPGVGGVTIKIETTNSNVKLDSVYFRNKKFPLKATNSGYTGTIVHSNTRKNRIIASNRKKEYGNKVPDISKKIPFELKKDEAIVTFYIKNKEKLYKIKNLIETKPIEFP